MTPSKRKAQRNRKTDLLAMLAAAREMIGNLSSQYLVATIAAHYRTKQISLKDAAKACMMTEDNFSRANVIVDDEARRMVHEVEKFYTPHPFDYDFFQANLGCVVVRRDGKPARFAREVEDSAVPLAFISENEHGEEQEYLYTKEGFYIGDPNKEYFGPGSNHPMDLMIRGM